MPGRPKVWDGKQWLSPTGNLKLNGGGQQLTPQKGWVFDGLNWLSVYEFCDVQLESVTAHIGSDGNGCAGGKCVRSVSWTTNLSGTVLVTDYHIRVLVSESGGSFVEVLDDASVDRRCGTLDTCGDSGATSGITGDGDGCYCYTCGNDGTSYQFKVRLEEGTGDSLACGNGNNEKTTATLTNCGGGA